MQKQKRHIRLSEYKESFIILCIIIWVINSIRPATPLLSDAIQHSFNSKQHHLKLHLDGKDHIDSEIANILEEESGSQATSQTISKLIDNPFIMFEELSSQIFWISASFLFFNYSISKHPLNILLVQSPPPKYAFLPE